MTSTVRELAALVGGEVHGDGDTPIVAAVPLKEARVGQITFIDHDKYVAELCASAASAAVVGSNTPANGKAFIRVADPFAAFVQIVRHLHGRPEPKPMGIDPRAVVDPTATIGPDASVGPFAVVGAGAVIGARCRIHAGAVVGAWCIFGDDVTLFPHAVVYDDCVLGNRVTLHAGVVIGADGFGYRFKNGRHEKVPQQGRVEIGDDVEIGACSTVDRATFGATRIGTGTKIDNLVQIGHNCQIGRHNVIVSQVGMAGSSSTGEYVVLAGQVGVVEHVHIGDRAVVGGQAGVMCDLGPGQRYMWGPAMPEREAKRIVASLPEVPAMRKTLKKVLKKLGMEEDEAA
ncbi:MAG: UDP-3-O-(3-hydroxymyristoyl)glucosamine N-acyltransferase [Gemmataceae bacterium]